MEESRTESTSSKPAAGGGSIGSAPLRRIIGSALGWIWGIALTAGVVAGLISWVGGEIAQNTYQPRRFPTVVPGGAIEMRPTASSTNVAEFKNGILIFAILGGITGLSMGLSGGLVGQSPYRGMVVGLGALVSGMLVGALISLALLRFFYRSYVADPNDLLSPILIHGGIWMAIGAVGGFAFALGMGRWRRIPAAIDGAVGGFFASILFQTLTASFFPDAESLGPSPARRLSASWPCSRPPS